MEIVVAEIGQQRNWLLFSATLSRPWPKCKSCSRNRGCGSRSFAATVRFGLPRDGSRACAHAHVTRVLPRGSQTSTVWSPKFSSVLRSLPA